MSTLNYTGTAYIDQLNAIKASDERTLGSLYTLHYKKVETFIIKNSGSTEHAKDIYQEAFVAMWRNIQIDLFQPKDSSSIGNYLFTIARNKWMDHLRSANVKKAVIHEISEENLMTIEQTDDNTIRRLELVKEKFRQLGDSCRELLKRFYYEREPLKHIAAAFNWTEATAKNNKYRCIEKLRALVKKQDNE